MPLTTTEIATYVLASERVVRQTDTPAGIVSTRSHLFGGVRPVWETIVIPYDEPSHTIAASEAEALAAHDDLVAALGGAR